MDDAGVLVDLQTNQIFEANDTGMRIWELLVDGAAEDDLPSKLAAEFAVDPEDARREVQTFLSRLHGAGLLV
jgi:hypothetical protein